MSLYTHGAPTSSSGGRVGQLKQSSATQQQEFSFFAHFTPLSGQQKQVAHQILPHLFLGSAAAARSATWLRQNDITHIVCVHNTLVSPSELKQQLCEHIRLRRRLLAANAQASTAAAVAPPPAAGGAHTRGGAPPTSAVGAAGVGAATAHAARVSRVSAAASASVAAQLVLYGERYVYCCCFAQDTPQHLLLPVLPHAIAFLDNALRDSSYRGGSSSSTPGATGGGAGGGTDGRREGMGRNHCFVSAEEAVSMYSDDSSSAAVDATAAAFAEATPQQQGHQPRDGAATCCGSDNGSASGSETAALMNGVAGGDSSNDGCTSSSSDGRERLQLLLQSRKQMKRPTKQRGNVLVHCAKGISRSPSFVICYLMYRRCWSYNDSFLFVRRKRPVYPNVGFQIQLQHLQRKLERMRPSLPNAAAEQDGEEGQQQKKKRITAAGLLLGSCCGDDGADDDEPDLFRRDPSAPEKLLTILRESATSLDEGQLQNRICAATVTQLLQLQELVEKMYTQSTLLRDRQKWQCFGLFFENLKSYAVHAPFDVLQIAQQIATKAQELKLVFTATLPGVVMADVVAEEIKRWVRVVKEKERDRLIKQEEELLRRERDAAFTCQEEDKQEDETEKQDETKDEGEERREGKEKGAKEGREVVVAGGGDGEGTREEVETGEGSGGRKEELGKEQDEDGKKKEEEDHHDALRREATAAGVVQMNLHQPKNEKMNTSRMRSSSTSSSSESGRNRSTGAGSGQRSSSSGRNTSKSSSSSSSREGSSSTSGESAAAATASVRTVAAGAAAVAEKGCEDEPAEADRESFRGGEAATSDAASCAARLSSSSAAAASAAGAGLRVAQEAACERPRCRNSASEVAVEEKKGRSNDTTAIPPADSLHEQREPKRNEEVQEPATTRAQQAFLQQQLQRRRPDVAPSSSRTPAVPQKRQKTAETPSPSSALEAIHDEETRRRLERLKKKWLKKELKKEKKAKKKLKKQRHASKKEWKKQKRKLEKQIKRAAACGRNRSSSGSERTTALAFCSRAVGSTATAGDGWYTPPGGRARVADAAADAAPGEAEDLPKLRHPGRENSEETGSSSSSCRSSSRERFSSRSRSSSSSSERRSSCRRSTSRGGESALSPAIAYRRSRSSGSFISCTTPKSAVSPAEKKLVMRREERIRSSNQVRSHSAAEVCSSSKFDVRSSRSPVSSREARHINKDVRTGFDSPGRRETCRSSSRDETRRIKKRSEACSSSSNDRSESCSSNSSNGVSEACSSSRREEAYSGSSNRREEACNSGSNRREEACSSGRRSDVCSSRDSRTQTTGRQFGECRGSVLHDYDSRRDSNSSRTGSYRSHEYSCSREPASCSSDMYCGYNSKKTKACDDGTGTCSSRYEDSGGRGDASCGSSTNRDSGLRDMYSSRSDAYASDGGDVYSSRSKEARYREESLPRKGKRGTGLHHSSARMWDRVKNDSEGEREEAAEARREQEGQLQQQRGQREAEAEAADERRGGGGGATREKGKGPRLSTAVESDEEELTTERRRGSSSSRVYCTRERDEERFPSSQRGRRTGSSRCGVEGRPDDVITGEEAAAATEEGSNRPAKRFKPESCERRSRRDSSLLPSGASERKRRAAEVRRSEER